MNARSGLAVAKAAAAAGLGLALAMGVAGCHKTPPAAADNNGAVDQNGNDPADANMASVSGGSYAQQPAQVLGQRAANDSQQQGEDYTQQGAPIERRAPDGSAEGTDSGGQMTEAQAEQVYNADLTDEQSTEPPPPLPEYDQPPDPDPNDLWTPGYWGWGAGGYYWVPGVWVAAPYVGALWTPGYWGFVGGGYRFHHGFWGTHIGFYGGVDYGYGYVGHGYYGGYWNHGNFFYNTAVNRVNVNTIHDVYVHNVVINNVTVNNRIVDRVSYNGGRGGVTTRPVAAEVAVLHEQRIPPMASQVQVRQEAAQNKAQFYSENKGRPAIAVAARPVAADRTMPAALPRIAGPAPGAQGFHGPEARPGQPQPAQAAHPEPGPQVRNAPEAGRPGPENRQLPQNRPAPEARPVQPQQLSHPVEPRQEGRPPEPQPQVRPAQPQARPVQPQPQARPAPEARSAPQAPRTEAAPAPRPQVHAVPPPHPAPAPRPQVHPAPPPHPAPAPATHPDEKPHR